MRALQSGGSAVRRAAALFICALWCLAAMAECTGRDMGERKGKAPEKTGVTYADKFYDDAGERCLTTRLVQDDDYLYLCGSTALYRVDRQTARARAAGVAQQRPGI